MPTYRDLAGYSDWVGEASRQRRLYPRAAPGRATQHRIRQILRYIARPDAPIDVRIELRWESDGLAGEELTWSVGYGPRTHAWVLRPAGHNGPLPGVLALHGHDGFKFFGKEKVADGPDGSLEAVRAVREELYEGLAFANELAARGFVVLAHDVFLWGSRRFPPEAMTSVTTPHDEDLDPVTAYNHAARRHEHVIAKYCSILGTTLAGVVTSEDNIAVRYLRSRQDVREDRVGCVGLSGGGCRAALLQATCGDIGASVVVGMMSTRPELLDHHVEPHTWMFFPDGLADVCDWPDLAACRAPSPLLVQYNREDHLFSPAGMRDAHERLSGHYAAVEEAGAYAGQFYDGPHKFDVRMQEEAFAWLAARLA